MSDEQPSPENVSNPPAAHFERTSKPRGPSPLVWVVVGLSLGVVGTAALLSRNKTSKPQVVVLRPRTTKHPEPVVKEGGGAAETLAERPQPQNAVSPANPFGGPTGGSAFILPKLAGHMPAQPLTSNLPAGLSASGLSGVILPRNLPTPPPAWTSPPAPGEVPRLPLPSESGLMAGIPKNLPKAPQPLSIPKETPKAVPAKPAATLVTVREIANDGAGTADDLIAFAAKLGGKAQALTEQGPDKKPVVKGVLVSLPPRSVEDLLKHISEGNALIDKDTWNGSIAERRDKLVEDAQARFASLKRLREALLVTYLEDAQPVLDVDEEIGKATKSLDQLRTDNSTDALTIVRISFVSRD